MTKKGSILALVAVFALISLLPPSVSAAMVSPDGQNRLPQGNHLQAVWSEMNSGTTSDLFGVWGSSPYDVFAVEAGGTILHYMGQPPTTTGPPITITETVPPPPAKPINWLLVGSIIAGIIVVVLIVFFSVRRRIF